MNFCQRCRAFTLLDSCPRCGGETEEVRERGIFNTPSLERLRYSFQSLLNSIAGASKWGPMPKELTERMREKVLEAKEIFDKFIEEGD